MVPRTIRQQLNRLRRRERWLRFAWAAARGLAVAGTVLAGACLIDWFVDLRQDTPHTLRVGMLAGQAALWAVTVALLARVLGRRLSDTQLALWVEEKLPGFGHRLISAVQLNRKGAATRGMSAELIAAVTRQAEEQAAAANFAGVADHRRLRWALRLLAPPAAGVVALLVLCPQTVSALLARQFLADRPVPRSVALESERAEVVWPTGEEVVLRFRVTGRVPGPGVKGEVRLEPADNGPVERHELVFESRDESGAVFVARVPPAAVDFTCRAWLEDGRTHRPARVHFEPRPVVQKLQAWVQLPASCGLRPDSRPFEEVQKGGDIVHRLPSSRARIAVEVQKPFALAAVEALGPPHPFARNAGDRGQDETVRRTVYLTLQGDGSRAEGIFSFQTGMRPEFVAILSAAPSLPAPQGVPWAALVLSGQADLLPAETGYRIRVRDRFGFENTERPRRNIRRGTVEPPEVVLRPESFWREGDPGPREDYEVEGIPVLLGQRIPIAYDCRAAYGLSHARIRYRVIRKGQKDEASAPPRDSDFLPLPLGAVRGTARVSKKAREEFYTLPADSPEKLDGTEGGGRYDLDSAGIPDGQGGLLALREGDRIQYFVEVFGRHDPEGEPGRSAVREKEVVSLKDYLAWLERKEDQKERIRRLEEKQRGTFGTGEVLHEGQK